MDLTLIVIGFFNGAAIWIFDLDLDFLIFVENIFQNCFQYFTMNPRIDLQ